MISFFLILISSPSFSQTTLIDGVDYNRDSRSLALILNTNGYSSSFRFSKRVDGFRSRLIDIDFAWYKHPKEQRIVSRYGSESKFVYGKLNQLIVWRLGYGRQKEIYGKYASEGIAISYYYTLGLNLGLLKPVYYDVVRLSESGEAIIVSEKFDRETIVDPGQIYGGTSFFKGFEDMSVAYGGFAKFAVSFDINKKYKGINTLELGIVLDVFHKKVPLMAYSSPKQYFFTMFVAYRFGKKMEQRINNQ